MGTQWRGAGPGAHQRNSARCGVRARAVSVASALALTSVAACVRSGDEAGGDRSGEGSPGSQSSAGASTNLPKEPTPGNDGALGLAGLPTDETSAPPGATAGGGVPPSGDAAAKFGCSGSAAVAFEESYAAQGRALAASLASLEARSAHERDVWRVARRSIVRSLSVGRDGDASLAALAIPSGAGSGDEGNDASSSRDEGNDDGTRDAGGVERSVREGAADATGSCKRLGALVAALRVSGRSLEAKGTALCGTLAPARAGALAAQVACRLETRAARSVPFVSFADTLPPLAPSCGAGYARACEAVFRARLGEGGARPACKGVASDARALEALAKWACRKP